MKFKLCLIQELIKVKLGKTSNKIGVIIFFKDKIFLILKNIISWNLGERIKKGILVSSIEQSAGNLEWIKLIMI